MTGWIAWVDLLNALGQLIVIVITVCFIAVIVKTTATQLRKKDKE